MGKNLAKAFSTAFLVLAVLLSDVMCAFVAYRYCDMVWGIRFAGYSAPAETAFLTAVPFLIAIAVCLVLAFLFRKKAR